MSILIQLLDGAIEWVVSVRYSCNRHVAKACGMPDASCGWNGQASQWANPDWWACRENAGYAGTKGGIPRLAKESLVGSPAWHARLIFTAAESMQQLLDQARLLHGIILPPYPEHALQLPSGASGLVREGMLQNA